MTNEPPRGLRANLLQSYLNDPIGDIDFFYSVKGANGAHFRGLLFALCFFHGVVQERCKFGPIGWNIPYEFNESDLRISIQQLKMFVEEQEDLPLKALRYTVGECNYGGRVTDDNDRKTLRYILERFYSRASLEGGHSFMEADDTYCALSTDSSYEDYVAALKKLPSVEISPAIYGLHGNATISRNVRETETLFSSLLLCVGSNHDTNSGGIAGNENPVLDLSQKILKGLPTNFDITKAQLRYPIKWEESMNTVLIQELGRFNTLLDIIRTSLEIIEKAILGIAIMSNDLREIEKSLAITQVPKLWLDASYPSQKSLLSYIEDLHARIRFFSRWLEETPPCVYWISGFFFTQAFITGTLQNYARQNRFPIDQVRFNFKFMSQRTFSKPPKSGVYVNGLYFEAASWDDVEHMLVDSRDGELISSAPTIMLKPVSRAEVQKYPFECPVYRTMQRRGMLSTTGLSTNFVMLIGIPTMATQAFWKLRGAALICSLSD